MTEYCEELKPDQEYERIVADIIRQLETDEKVAVTHHARYRGKSGHVHVTDIAVQFVKLGVQFIVLVECKYWNRKVGVQEVMVLSSRLNDVGAHKGILVTTEGFQKGAFALAKDRGIALVLCKDAVQYDTLLERTSAQSGGDADAVIASLFEVNHSFYVANRETGIAHTAFPLLLDSIT